MSNSPNSQAFKSTQALFNRHRKQSYEISSQRFQEEGQNNRNNNRHHENAISDIDVSLIQKKYSQISKSQAQGISSPPVIGSPRKKYQTHSENQVNGKQKDNEMQGFASTNFKKRKTPQFTHQNSGRSQQSSAKQFSYSNTIPINYKALWQYTKIILFSYEFNLLDYLRDIDPVLIEQVIDLLKIAPGYKPIQYIYTFYMFKYGIAIGVMAAMLYPLPYSILFLMIPVDLHVPLVALFMLAGMRSGALALLLKYCLHFPKQTFHWIVLAFTVFAGVLMPNNYIFLLLFGISIFLSFYLKKFDRTSSSSSSSSDQNSGNVNPSALNISSFGLNFNQQQIYKYYKVIDGLPDTYPTASILILTVSLALLWILQRYFQNRQLTIFQQVVPVSLLANSKEMLAFFPYIYQTNIGTSTLSPSTFIAMSFLFPGPHSKAFMFFIVHSQLLNDFICYLCLYMPAILLTNIFIGYRPHFYTSTYYNIRQSIQAVGNGIVFCLVIWMLTHEQCFFNCILYSAVVIMVVAKLYRLRELFAITLGILLISIRSIILNVNKGVSFQEQACLMV